MNPAPDADDFSVGKDNFEWIVQNMAELAIRKAQQGPVISAFHWGQFLSAGAVK
jgi:hypothetical protein